MVTLLDIRRAVKRLNKVQVHLFSAEDGAMLVECTMLDAYFIDLMLYGPDVAKANLDEAANRIGERAELPASGQTGADH